MSELTAERLRELLHYNPETGVFTWRVSNSNRAPAGSVAGTAHGAGYRELSLDGGRYLEHRLAWFYVHGVWPTAGIDHRDGDRVNNRLLNLREATKAENQQNRAAQANNKSGFVGVSWYKRGHAWVAQIGVGGRQRRIGLFDTPEAAHAAYLAAKKQLHTFQPTPRTTKTKASNEQTNQTSVGG